MPADVLVGRRLSVDTLRSAVDAAMAGAGGVVLLAGEAGMGKTALAAEAAAYAKARGAVAVWGTCWEGEGAPGYWPWIQVLRALARDGGGEAVLAALTGANEASDGVLGDEAAVRFRTYDATAAYLRELSAARPLVVVLDDLHWADISSLRLLLFLARQLHGGSALVIGTYRDVEVMLGEHPARGLLAELAGRAELLQLAGLTASEVGQLLNEVCREWPPAALAATVHERTGGNPFFVQQTARLLAAQGAPLDHASVTGVPRAVGDVLARRLARLPGEVVDLLAIAAVAGKRFAIAAVAGIAGLPAEDAVPLLDRAVRAGVVEQDSPGGGRFSHDLFREVLYEGLPRRGGRRCTSPWRSCWSVMRTWRPRRRRSPTTARWRCRWETAAGRWPRLSRRAGRRPPGWPSTRPPVIFAVLSTSPAASRAPVPGRCANTATRCAGRETARAHGPRSSPPPGAPAPLVTPRCGPRRVRPAPRGHDDRIVACGRDRAARGGARRARTRAGRHAVAVTASLARELTDGPDRDRPRAIALGAAAVDGARAAGAQTGRGRRALAETVRWTVSQS